MTRSCPHYNITQQRLVHIFYGGVSSHNRTSLNASYGGNLILKSPIDSIKIIEDMFSNPYNIYGDRTIMKRGIHQIEKDESLPELGK